jgi:predicted metal-dependent peptidase
MMARLSAEQRIERTHVQLMKHPNFCLFSGLFMIGKVEVKDDTASGTAQTNGLDVIYDRAFIDRLNDKQIAFLVLHENMHKAYRHLIVWQKLYKENATLANLACDYVINLQIQDYDRSGAVVEMPTDAEGNVMGCIDEAYRGMDAHQVYNELVKKHGKDAGKVKVLVQNGHPSSDGQGGEQSDGNVEKLPESFDSHDWDGAQEATQEEQEAQAKEIESALRQGSILVGKMGGNVERGISEMLTPKIDWKEALREFVKSATQGKDKTTWRRLHKRYIASDIIMPSSYNENVGNIIIGIDTSGSIGTAELNQFLSEVKSICEEVSPEAIDLLYWDTHVASRETYMNNELAGLTESTKPAGGGGTDPTCVPKFMAKHNIKGECLLMLTDGYIGHQDASDYASLGSIPLLWCVKGNDRFSSVVGKTVHVE